ncbi:hypothetical protein HIM_11746 [Hirsutella minnesotensis 3608]|uniref:Uncharacterized protein n=1 Tax=Hirsutella minnesotensis 3608 TaxID=1043627 RepID=A0A0F7ZIT4_9HYPO|nr:hypothetical protein HIM_11746 [Hirsutella minnesotensis 3608]
MAEFIASPMAVGVSPPGAKAAFSVEKLRPDGSRNPDYSTPPYDGPSPNHSRSELYDYYTYKNAWLDMLGEVDPGYAWATEPSPVARERVDRWPPTVILHGDADDDVPLSVSEQMRDCLGRDKVSLFTAHGQPHLFELTSVIDDDVPEMGVVRDAVKRLDELPRSMKIVVVPQPWYAIGMDVCFSSNRNHNREVQKWHDTILVPKWGLRPPNIDGKAVLGTDDLLAATFFSPSLGPAEIVDNEKRRPKDGTWEELYGTKVVRSEDSCQSADEDARLLEAMLYQETVYRGRPKALCYEDILLSIVRHPETGNDVPTMAIRFIHHEGVDRKPKPTIFLFAGTRKLMFCIITVIVSLAISDQAFDAPSLKTASNVFQIQNRGPGQCTPLRWQEEWLKRPVFRGFDGSTISQRRPLPYH